MKERQERVKPGGPDILHDMRNKKHRNASKNAFGRIQVETQWGDKEHIKKEKRHPTPDHVSYPLVFSESCIIPSQDHHFLECLEQTRLRTKSTKVIYSYGRERDA